MAVNLVVRSRQRRDAVNMNKRVAHLRQCGISLTSYAVAVSVSLFACGSVEKTLYSPPNIRRRRKCEVKESVSATLPKAKDGLTGSPRNSYHIIDDLYHMHE